MPQYLTWQCPCCGEYLYADSQMYIDHTGTVLGCDNCAKRVEAADYFSKEE